MNSGKNFAENISSNNSNINKKSPMSMGCGVSIDFRKKSKAYIGGDYIYKNKHQYTWSSYL